jgi:hypothetical protein
MYIYTYICIYIYIYLYIYIYTLGGLNKKKIQRILKFKFWSRKKIKPSITKPEEFSNFERNEQNSTPGIRNSTSSSFNDDDVLIE